MMKPKVMQRKSGDPPGMRLKKGMAVLMEDGWRGRVEQDGAEIIICIADEERPNDYFRGYRGFATGT
jgi:hypothetical protein